MESIGMVGGYKYSTEKLSFVLQPLGPDAPQVRIQSTFTLVSRSVAIARFRFRRG